MNGLEAISNICEKDKLTNRANILRYEKFARTMPQIEIPVKHYIHGGMYVREITIPKDTIITGQIYKFDHFDIMISGDVTVSTDTGETKRFTGYNLFQGLNGKKRAGVAHEDTTWITVHPFSFGTGDEIQEYITASDFQELEDFTIKLNRADYLSLVDSINMTEEEIRTQVEAEHQEIDNSKITVKPSPIDGLGVYATLKLFKGDLISPMRIGNDRTQAGRYTNHALQPNATMGNDLNLYAKSDIEKGEEITVNYREILTTRHIKGDLI